MNAPAAAEALQPSSGAPTSGADYVESLRARMATVLVDGRPASLEGA